MGGEGGGEPEGHGELSEWAERAGSGASGHALEPFLLRLGPMVEGWGHEVGAMGP